MCSGPVAGSDGLVAVDADLHHVRLQRRHGLHLHPQQEHHQVHQDEAGRHQAKRRDQGQEEQSSSRQRGGGRTILPSGGCHSDHHISHLLHTFQCVLLVLLLQLIRNVPTRFPLLNLNVVFIQQM